jgi:hypothetical protein
MGQQIRFIYIGPGPGVQAWDLAESFDVRKLDILRYRELVFRAVHEIVQPLGVTEKTLRDWLFSKAGYITPPGLLASADSTRLEIPLFNTLKYIRVDAF